jgi:hypothetical protein
MKILVLCGIKVLVHYCGLERISINPLFSAMVPSTIFLLGFLLSGVLTHFKESEKIPAELATSLQTLNLEIQAIQAYHPEAQIAAALSAVTGLGQSLDASTLKGRLMQHLAVILAKIHRVQSIKDTSFVPLVYWMADVAAALLFAGLMIARANSLCEPALFLAVISFAILILLHLINNIDNLFGLSDINLAENVLIKLLEEAVGRLGAAAS